MLALQQKYQLNQIIEYVYNEDIEDAWDSQLDGLDVFMESHNGQLSPSSFVYIDKSDPNVNTDNIEGYSSFVTANHLELLCRGDTFIDVIEHYRDQKKVLNMDLAIESLKYYLQKDDFQDLE